MMSDLQVDTCLQNLLQGISKLESVLTKLGKQKSDAQAKA